MLTFFIRFTVFFFLISGLVSCNSEEVTQFLPSETLTLDEGTHGNFSFHYALDDQKYQKVEGTHSLSANARFVVETTVADTTLHLSLICRRAPSTSKFQRDIALTAPVDVPISQILPEAIFDPLHGGDASALCYISGAIKVNDEMTAAIDLSALELQNIDQHFDFQPFASKALITSENISLQELQTLTLKDFPTSTSLRVSCSKGEGLLTNTSQGNTLASAVQAIDFSTEYRQACRIFKDDLQQQDLVETSPLFFVNRPTRPLSLVRSQYLHIKSMKESHHNAPFIQYEFRNTNPTVIDLRIPKKRPDIIYWALFKHPRTLYNMNGRFRGVHTKWVLSGTYTVRKESPTHFEIRVPAESNFMMSAIGSTSIDCSKKVKIIGPEACQGRFPHRRPANGRPHWPTPFGVLTRFESLPMIEQTYDTRPEGSFRVVADMMSIHNKRYPKKYQGTFDFWSPFQKIECAAQDLGFKSYTVSLSTVTTNQGCLPAL